jgi:AhpC/TSA family
MQGCPNINNTCRVNNNGLGLEKISAWTVLASLIKSMPMSEGKYSRFPQATLMAMLAAAFVSVISILPAQAQKGNLVPNVSATNAAPGANAEVLQEVVVTGTGPNHDPKADKAWQELERAEKTMPNLPISFCWKLEFQSVLPEDVGKFLDKTWIPDDLKKADMARDFAMRFPYYSKVWDARIWEYDNLVEACILMGSWNEAEANLRQSGLPAKTQVWSFTDLAPRLITLERLLMENTNLPQSSQFHIRSDRLDRLSSGPEEDWLEAAEAMRRDFPQEEHSYEYLRRLIAQGSDDKARELAESVMSGPAPEMIKALMRTILGQLDLKGKPVSLRFTALDGRKVDTAAMRGKVVLIAFWEPDEILELLSEKALYEKFHAQGLETIGISLGQTDRKGRLEKLLKAQKIPWPQYFDGKGWDSEMARRFGIYHSPTLLLLDKHGVLREIDTLTAGFPIVANGVVEKVGVVRAGHPPGSLEEKIKSLLAEPSQAP